MLDERMSRGHVMRGEESACDEAAHTWRTGRRQEAEGTSIGGVVN
jgi:hypothetical protein